MGMLALEVVFVGVGMRMRHAVGVGVRMGMDSFVVIMIQMHGRSSIFHCVASSVLYLESPLL